MRSAPADVRLARAEEFLQEAVYRSRGEQAGAGVLDAGGATCGLGRKASVVLDLTPRAQELYAELFPDGLAADRVERVRELVAAWVRKQDALDRKRNHFLKDFRNAHGFDRRVYTEEETAAFTAGLAAVNDEAAEARRASAAALLAIEHER